jgi:hypothetical protein
MGLGFLAAGIGVAGACPARADFTLIENTTTISNNDLATETASKDIVYLAPGKPRTATYDGDTLVLSAIYDAGAHLWIEINWSDRAYFRVAWHPSTRPPDPKEYRLVQQPTNSYRTILGHRCRLYLDSATGTALQGRTATGHEWIAADVPGDIRSTAHVPGRALS